MAMAFARVEDEEGKGGVALIDTVEEIKRLTDVGAMTRFLHECIAYQRCIDAELETLLSHRHELEKKRSGLDKSSEVLEIVIADSDQMLLSVSSTCDLADHVSGKVRELDLAQSRVQSTLTRIDAIVERGNCIDGAKQVLESEDYEAAAKYVETFLNLDAKYNDSIVTGNDDILRSLCGEDGIVYAIWELQEQCDSRGSIILKKYTDYRRLAGLASEINSQNDNLISVVGAQEGPDPRQIEIYLE
ncbi:hypothetical protein KI387_041280 [Taxus chinensis]|uniref:Conserved oligomeric Golgi complex subunit 4 n=1 Tax=Taxus chinensis TaxID=29808 RepID=A0AA38CAI8_TAXCH|nr:hypothetical protein KI387_041280 [Taxus chinensis]